MSLKVLNWEGVGQLLGLSGVEGREERGLTSAVMGLLEGGQAGLGRLVVVEAGGAGVDGDVGAGLLGGTGGESTGVLDGGSGGIVDGEVVCGEVVMGAGTRVVSSSLFEVVDPPVLGPAIVVPCAVVRFAVVAPESTLPWKLPYNFVVATFLSVVVRGMGITSCVTVA